MHAIVEVQTDNCTQYLFISIQKIKNVIQLSNLPFYLYFLKPIN